MIAIVFEEMAARWARGVNPCPSPRNPDEIPPVGLQGSGKTTTCVKIARRSPTATSLSGRMRLRRPAAVDQLRILAGQAGVGFFGPSGGEKDVLPLSAGQRSTRPGGFTMSFSSTGRPSQIDDHSWRSLPLWRDPLPDRDSPGGRFDDQVRKLSTSQLPSTTRSP